MTLLAYVDCFAGISGDMCLGALINAGWPVERLQTVIQALKLPDVSASVESVSKHGIAGTQVRIHSPSDQPHRGLNELGMIIKAAGLTEEIQRQAWAVLQALGEAESQVHGVPIEQIHFHEVGAVDTLVDIVGTVTALHDLNIDTVYSTPLPWSHGTIRTAHGILPVPPPAVAALLKGIPVVGVDVQGEMVTPTGAALVRTLAKDFVPMPALLIQRIGYGAGTREWPDRPNLLRVVIGQAEGQAAIKEITTETLALLACNIDDMNPQWYGPLMQMLLDAHALDVWLTPVQMKKNRPGTVIQVLCQIPDAMQLRDLLLRHTTTLGVRQDTLTRYALNRQIQSVQTPFGPVRVKIAFLPDGTRRVMPEHDDCVVRASEHSVSIREVWLAALHACEGQGAPPKVSSGDEFSQAASR